MLSWQRTHVLLRKKQEEHVQGLMCVPLCWHVQHVTRTSVIRFPHCLHVTRISSRRAALPGNQSCAARKKCKAAKGGSRRANQRMDNAEKSDKRLKEEGWMGEKWGSKRLFSVASAPKHPVETLSAGKIKRSPTEGELVLWLDVMWFCVLQCHPLMFRSYITRSVTRAFVQLPASQPL